MWQVGLLTLNSNLRNPHIVLRLPDVPLSVFDLADVT